MNTSNNITFKTVPHFDEQLSSVEIAAVLRRIATSLGFDDIQASLYNEVCTSVSFGEVFDLVSLEEMLNEFQDDPSMLDGGFLVVEDSDVDYVYESVKAVFLNWSDRMVMKTYSLSV